MKLPNGYGSIVKLSGKRRKPYMVRITQGKKYVKEKDDYVYNRFVLGYYKSRSLALEALAEYNANPFTLSTDTTFIQIYNMCDKKYLSNLSKSSKASRATALKHCEPIFDMKLRDITYSMVQECVDCCQAGSASKKMIKTVMNTVFEYGLKNNLIGKNPASYIKIEYSDPVIDRIIFSDSEIKFLWSKADHWDYMVLLMLLYTGMRVNELLKNWRKNVDLENATIHIPVEYAKNSPSIRTIPIPDKVFPFFQNFYEWSAASGKEKFMCKPNGTVITYNNFVSRELLRINKDFEVPHKFHDTRHTFATLCHRYSLDELTAQRIMGHEPDTLMKKLYTHITIDDMRKEINKIRI